MNISLLGLFVRGWVTIVTIETNLENQYQEINHSKQVESRLL